MTLKIRIQVPKDAGPYEAKVRIGANDTILAPGDEIEAYVYAGQDIQVTEAPAGTKANHMADQQDDFPLGKACDLSGEGACEACQ